MIDLHTHSLASDGTDTPGELINKAHARGISVLGLMDHDTVAGWDEACLLYTSPSPRDRQKSRMPSSA